MKLTEKEMLTIEKQRLIALCEAFHDMNEPEKEEQLSELFLKVTNEEYAIAFCGHFSAGKSSLINALSSTGILPASPIPTSANIVKMKKGTPRAVVWLKDKKVVTFNSPYDVEEIKHFCKDGNQVQSIEIFYESDTNSSNLTFYDTPGIDSTDPAHKEATENVIHLADLIFYVMDYNHILSETNVEFIKDLTQKGKAVRLIINQIDKHRDDELSFKDFKEHVFKSFESYGINKEDIFFTSVKNKSFPHNDLPAINAYLKKIEMNKDQLLIEGTERQLDYFVSNFIEQTEKDTDHIESITERLRILQEEIVNLQLEIEKNIEQKREKEESLKSQFSKIVDSAQLMPYETREKAGLFIESCKKDFKVGLFFSKQKTNQERDERNKAFQEKINESIDAHINWHAQNLVNKLQKEYSCEIPQWTSVELPKETLQSFVQPGLSSDGQGLLNYCESIAGEAKKRARQQMSEITQAVIYQIDETENEKTLLFNERADTLNQNIQALTVQKNIALKWEDQKNELIRILSIEEKDGYGVEEYTNQYASQYESISIDQFKKLYVRINDEHTSNEENVEQMYETNTEKVNGLLEKETEKLLKTAALIKPISFLNHLSEEMENLAKRLTDRYFTIVLFGAFSAGKSSFANALLGENILPSSPNPTTAAINEVRKPDQNHAHGIVEIEMKTENELKDEINSILKTDIEDLQSLMRYLNSETSIEDKKQKHLQAFKEGYEDTKNYLSKTITSDLTEISKYAAVEKNACFVKKITIYYSCPLTEKGIVLVDTPGANSIHSRHTEVAFEYMKHADIILYLTYFNHAFSHADREFLIQLGRIKDTFSSDKMFFAINASDLANSQEDKIAVVDHVKNNLQTFGIRHPRLHPVSSKNEISGIEEPDNGFSSFRSSLNRYLESDLEKAMVTSSVSTRNHAKKVIRNMKEETNLRLQKEDEYLESVQQRESSLIKICEEKISVSGKRLDQEMKELLYYVKQRVMIRYHDFYKETIHPAAVKSSKADLLQCLDELYEKLAHDLKQEYRACSLRLDKWIQTQMNEKEKTILNEAVRFQADLQIPAENKTMYATPKVPSAFSDQIIKDKKSWLSYYKNAKQFFENGGSNELRNDLIKEIEEGIASWLHSVEEVLQEHYIKVVENVQQYSKLSFEQQIHHYFSELKKPGDLEGKIQTLECCLNDIEKI